MDFTEPTEDEPEGKRPDIAINISSPNNRIAVGDYFEVNIHLGSRSGPETPESEAESVSEIRRVLDDMADYLRRERHPQATSKQ